jgi:hypothetical protein
MKLRTLMSSIFVVSAASASGAVLTVDAQANIFGAGHSTAPGNAWGGGVLPPVYTFTAKPGLVLTFSSVTGTVSSGANTAGPDGAQDGPSTDMESLGGISGIIDGSSGFFLVGLFASDAEPQDPAPPRLDFSAGLESLTVLTPALNQTFFVGDGLTGTGTGPVQRFKVPDGATRLFLGFADGNTMGVNSDLYNYHGVPGYYSDNTGTGGASVGSRSDR